MLRKILSRQIPSRRIAPGHLAAVLVAPMLLPLSLAACASTTSGDDATTPVSDGSSFRLSPGQGVTLADNSRLRYLRLVNDSRCAPDVQCVWAGDAIVAFEWTPAGGDAERFELHTGLEPRSHAIGGRTLTLQALERGEAPAATLRVDAGG